jgi:hypothetical protein
MVTAKESGRHGRLQQYRWLGRGRQETRRHCGALSVRRMSKFPTLLSFTYYLLLLQTASPEFLLLGFSQ